MSYLKHKPGSIEELMANEASKLNDNAYQQMFKKELDKAGKGIGSMSPAEKKDFFNKIDKMYKGKNEAKVDELTAGQKKLPPALQKAIKDKEDKKAYDKQYYENNKESRNKQIKQYQATPEGKKAKTICDWRRRGLIETNQYTYVELYETYLYHTNFE